ncbi:DHA2 family efflux MFS transporter permease subunit [Frankia nepalensis]|uniref:DHA2 family efflux MFS transporter permease subunit n=1 Tax=Frankia nepalensis TaxID=1836974 RepID=A0A937UU38_9ACTN|nr:DHA2 family efflux MFS transporter permease subunit [Frankia nepalensis]MBL7502131.1 DHA2 family efflux MFS transporter permease subunit [Frankia nepalensis]MBL7516166.1 DHA2 family efflux MFS transporter permease subunit [Frankia nepalensis]MBL7633703.1 DHA2 family efflux MFS transporter permease subunit [Frankia nepalensis]
MPTAVDDPSGAQPGLGPVAPTATATTADAATRSDQAADPRRWAILGILGIAQLMVILDGTVVNIALPSAQASLGFSDGNRQWIITSYTLAFGGLLLLAGRLSDLFGTKKAFLVGVLGFAAASVLGGAATGFEMLVIARALQGVFGALLAPAALALLTTTFTDPRERGKAFGIFGAIAGAGGAIGLLLGGVLTEYLSWRWCMYINLVFAAVAGIGGATLLAAHVRGHRAPLDLPGTFASCVGLVAIVYGFAQAESRGWADGVTLALLFGGLVVMVGFVLLQRRVAHPLMPMRVLLDRNRGGSYLACGLSAIGMFGVFLFLTYYLQQVLDYSPVMCGVAFLPMSAAVMITATMSPVQLVPRFGARWVVVTGMVVTAVGMLLFARLGLDAGYASHVLPPLLCTGAGLGLVFGPAMTLSTYGVDSHDAGIASALVNTVQQVGGSIGTALLSTIATTATASYLAAHPAAAGSAPHSAADPARVLALAAIDGYQAAYIWAAAIFAVAAVICGIVLRGGRHAADGAVAPAAAHF